MLTKEDYVAAKKKGEQLLKEIKADPKKGQEFLKKAGILTSKGEVAAPYKNVIRLKKDTL